MWKERKTLKKYARQNKNSNQSIKIETTKEDKNTPNWHNRQNQYEKPEKSSEKQKETNDKKNGFFIWLRDHLLTNCQNYTSDKSKSDLSPCEQEGGLTWSPEGQKSWTPRHRKSNTVIIQKFHTAVWSTSVDRLKSELRAQDVAAIGMTNQSVRLSLNEQNTKSSELFKKTKGVKDEVSLKSDSQLIWPGSWRILVY